MSRRPHDNLELGEDPSFQRRFWYVQRIGWVVVAVFLVTGVLGLLGGSGPLVSATDTEPGSGISVEYQRFARKRSPITLQIHVPPDATESSGMTVRIDRNYLEWFSIEDISPEPSEVAAGDRELVYTFQSPTPGEETAVSFNLQAQRFGLVSGWVQLEQQPEVSFSQFIYP